MISQDRFYLRDRKGFTLVELVVSMTLTVIVLALAVTFVSLIANYSAIQQSDYESNVEYSEVIALVDEFRDSYSLPGYSLNDVKPAAISITDGDRVYVLTFNDATGILIADIKINDTVVTRSVALKRVTGISFTSSDKTINVEVVFASYPTRHYLVDFGAVL